MIAKPLETANRTVGGLILPESTQANVGEAKVLWVENNSSVKTGNTILYVKSAGLRYIRAGLNFVILRSVDILAVVYDE
ncbi:co-chaperone GroES family protein [Candidatus Hodgkinia cicadicola]